MKARLKRAGPGGVRLLGVSWDRVRQLWLGWWFGALVFSFLQQPTCMLCGKPAVICCYRTIEGFRDYFCHRHGLPDKGPCHNEEGRQHRPVDPSDYYYEADL